MKFFLFLMLVLFIASCKCKDVDCGTSVKMHRFNIVDEITNANLFFDSLSIYDKSNLKIFSLNGSDTVFHLLDIQNIEKDSFFVTWTFYDEKNLYFKISETDLDTFKIYYNHRPEEQKCCPKKTFVHPVTYNGTYMDYSLNGQNPYATFYKKI